MREPALKFIREMAPRLAILSPHFKADDRKVGGSLMRVYRIRSKIDEEQGRWQELINTKKFSRAYRQGKGS